MCGHRLGVLQRAAGFEISRDPGGSEGVAADLHARAEIGRTPLDLRQASTRFIGLSVKVPERSAAERKREVLPPSRIPATSIPSYSPHSRDSLAGMVQPSGIA
jgi:hypothetical protein